MRCEHFPACIEVSPLTISRPGFITMRRRDLRDTLILVLAIGFIFGGFIGEALTVRAWRSNPKAWENEYRPATVYVHGTPPSTRPPVSR